MAPPVKDDFLDGDFTERFDFLSASCLNRICSSPKRGFNPGDFKSKDSFLVWPFLTTIESAELFLEWPFLTFVNCFTSSNVSTEGLLVSEICKVKLYFHFIPLYVDKRD